MLHEKVDHLQAMLASIYPVDEALPATGSERKVQEAGLGTLVAIDRICRNNGLQYWLDGGTLLGAVRHKGFIPWDDDIDISMPVADRAKLIEILRSCDNGNEFAIYERPSSKTINVCKCSFAIGTKTVKKKRQTEQYVGGKMLTPVVDIFTFDEDKAANIWKSNFNGVLNFELNTCDLFPLKEADFEGHSFMVPQKPDVILTKSYGVNFQSWPPLDGQWSHGGKVDWFENEEEANKFLQRRNRAA
ncbi:phosphorylcholine metabolism protein LicD [Rhodopirellula rubra]|uniref:Phosphorylcholine metabolism protein LicD n=1 Tax=Aporhodopirellula rubra TaxID=980271 RepID=A0A7W5E1Z2_9BACT|nr:LicD family protein [Aporhodopirellula rubra]MBB3207812.1 phosphorylcholine metabolism protein LicD [Aporhodopirellula rubra]